jgi:hypothetical protein
VRPERIAPLLLAAGIACSGSHGGASERGTETSVPARSIDDVLAAHRDSLLALPGVVGTAIALYDGERCIRVMLADTSAEAKARIPARLEGYRVVVEVTGPFRPR